MQGQQGAPSSFLTGPGEMNSLDNHKCQGCQHLLAFENGKVIMILDQDNFPIGTFCSYGVENNSSKGIQNSYPINFFSEMGRIDAYVQCPIEDTVSPCISIEDTVSPQFPREFLRGLGGCMSD